MVDPSEINNFHIRLFDWWQGRNKRDLPWRNTENPYHIMISEFMLQQTQVNRVIPKYEAFLKEYPTLNSLADADKSDVITLWQGLGYNRRAIWLQEAANIIATKEEFPRNRKELQEIKGIGPYTSRSIQIFAFNAPYAAVDTNIRRIYIVEGFISEDMNKSEVQEIADQLVPRDRARDYHNALMDYGSTELTARNTGISPRGGKTTEFEGSNRQIRGKIIKLLTQRRMITLTELKSMINHPSLQLNLDNLEKEGLILKEGKNEYLLPS